MGRERDYILSAVLRSYPYLGGVKLIHNYPKLSIVFQYKININFWKAR